MKIESIYSVTHSRDSVCPRCGKVYPRTEEWAYKVSFEHGYLTFYCSWSCMRAAKAEREAVIAAKQMERKEKRKNLPRYVSQAEKEGFCQMYADGWSALEISDETGRSMYAVQSAIKERYGCYVPPARRNKAG